jgi:hypothetical protein
MKHFAISRRLRFAGGLPRRTQQLRRQHAAKHRFKFAHIDFSVFQCAIGRFER